MAYEISNGTRTAKIELLNRTGNKVRMAVDDRKYDLDIVEVEKGVYSILYNGLSYNVELIEGGSSKKYIVNTFIKTYNIEIIDAETKYINNRNQGMEPEGANHIVSPMPGKVIKVLVNKGDKVEAGQTLVVVEAMKMQSEFKSAGDKIVRDILVKEGDTLNAHQLMVKLEDRS